MIRTRLCKLGLAGVICTSVLGGTASALPSRPASQATPVTKIVLTNSANGATVRAAKGDLVVVRLRATKAVQWSQASVAPFSTGRAVLVKESGRVGTGSSVTTFKVVGYGLATLEASGYPICTSRICPQYVLAWRADVVVPVQDPAMA